MPPQDYAPRELCFQTKERNKNESGRKAETLQNITIYRQLNILQLELQQIQPGMTNSEEQQTQTHPENESNIGELNIKTDKRGNKSGSGTPNKRIQQYLMNNAKYNPCKRP